MKGGRRRSARRASGTRDGRPEPGHYALAVVCTSSRFKVRSQLPSCVPFQAGRFGFTVDCVAQCENILSIDKRQLDTSAGPIGMLDETALREVIKAIGYVIESDCEPV